MIAVRGLDGDATSQRDLHAAIRPSTDAAEDIEDRRRIDAEEDGEHDQRHEAAASRGVMSVMC